MTFDTIKDLYKAAKTDRYTQDVYQVGEISKKTGLQKQADGSWAPPKSGAKKGIYTSGGEAHKEGSLYREDPAKLATQARKEGNLKKAEFYENEANKEKAESKGFKKMSLVRPDGSVKRHQTNNPDPASENKAAPEEDVTANQMPKGYVANLDKQTQTKLKEALRNHLSENGLDEGEAEDAIENMMDSKVSDLQDLWNENQDIKTILWNANKATEDAAPRQITGDCKIKIRK